MLRSQTMSNGWALLAAAVICHAAPGVASSDGLRLIWADEFDIDGPPDAKNWSFERGLVRNREAQSYQTDNARCVDGRLVIEARRQRVANERFDPTAAPADWRRSRPHADYTSALVKTEGKFAWRYGVLEVRARIDARAGLWPAIWTLGERSRWPACGEVDLMEYYRGDILANACWAPLGERRRRRDPIWDATRTPLEGLGGQAWAGEFHVWRMDWSRDRISLSVDDRLLNEIDVAATPVGPGGVHPFRQPHYLLLNLAIGGDNGGDPSDTVFPATFEVDYVRVYQRAGVSD